VTHGALCVGETGSGDQRSDRDRKHQTVSHQNLSSHVFIARADNEMRWDMFLRFAGSIAFVFLNAA
jgi:hypothetical protein